MSNRGLSATLVAIASLAGDAAFAAQTTEQKPVTFLALLITWLPLIALGVFMYWYIKKTGASGYRTQMDRARQHMEVVERQNAEVLETLKRIEAKLSNRQEHAG